MPGRPASWRKRRYAPGCRDRKSTRLNSSHQIISYAVFCLKKKNAINAEPPLMVPSMAKVEGKLDRALARRATRCELPLPPTHCRELRTSARTHRDLARLAY